MQRALDAYNFNGLALLRNGTVFRDHIPVLQELYLKHKQTGTLC